MNPHTPISKSSAYKILNCTLVHYFFPQSGNRLSQSFALPKNTFRVIDLKHLIRTGMFNSCFCPRSCSQLSYKLYVWIQESLQATTCSIFHFKSSSCLLFILLALMKAVEHTSEGSGLGA